MLFGLLILAAVVWVTSTFPSFWLVCLKNLFMLFHSFSSPRIATHKKGNRTHNVNKSVVWLQLGKETPWNPFIIGRTRRKRRRKVEVVNLFISNVRRQIFCYVISKLVSYDYCKQLRTRNCRNQFIHLNCNRKIINYSTSSTSIKLNGIGCKHFSGKLSISVVFV